MYLRRYSTSGEVAAAFSAGVSWPGSRPAVSAALPSSAPAAPAAGLAAAAAPAVGLLAAAEPPPALLDFGAELLLEPLHAASNAAVAALPVTRKRRRDATERRSQ